MSFEQLNGLQDAAWRGFLLTHDRLWRELENSMAQFDVSMAEYSVLALLGEAGPDGMRMSELAERRLMSSGGFTRMADRLERRGLIERRRSVADGRGSSAVLTDDGRALVRTAWKQQRHDLHRLFFDHLTDDDLQTLARIWCRLASDADSRTETF